MARRPPRAGLFTGYYTDIETGQRLGRIPRSAYPELYRLHRKYLVHRCGVNMFGCRSIWHHRRPA